MAYEHFYKYYDLLMNDVNYEDWIQIVNQYFNTDDSLLEVGCGTGTILIQLLEKGFSIDGLDISEEMLTIAKEKISQKKVSSNLFLGDMRELESEKKANYDGVICFLDSINYLETKVDVENTFKGIYHILKPDGIFIFDIHSIHKLLTKMDGYSYNETFNSFTYLWNTFVEVFNDHSILYHELSFFIKKAKNVYVRLDEAHKQTVFNEAFYASILEKYGFKIINILYDFNNSIDKEKCDRILFVSKKCL
ncbi:Putative methyltransferase YqeM protein [Haloplasma contractile SSD-17B]|uniref:Methyltransferase YqeM protein n=2 Tax=Haloplasma TaxID=471824 RepID=U2FLW3_9MOLU|nr:Putative methyltransferase YqeM protein [Haloplasma contractile SSD-17B]